MFEITWMYGKAKTDRSVGSTTGQVGEDLQDDVMVSKDSDPVLGYSREEENANEDEDDGGDDNVQVPDVEEIV